MLHESDVEPNDTYIEQLLLGAQATVKYLLIRDLADEAAGHVLAEIALWCERIIKRTVGE